MEEEDAASGQDDDMLTSLLNRFAGISVVDQRDLSRQFAQILGIDEPSADFFLAAANNNLENAINLYLDAMRERGLMPASAPPCSAGASAAAQNTQGRDIFEDPALLAAIAASTGQDIHPNLYEYAIQTQEYAVLPDGRAVLPGGSAVPAGETGLPTHSSMSTAQAVAGPTPGSSFARFDFSAALAQPPPAPPQGGGGGGDMTDS